MASIKGATVPGEMQKITFGNNLPGYVCGDKGAPAVVVLQMSAAARPPRWCGSRKAAALGDGPCMDKVHVKRCRCATAP